MGFSSGGTERDWEQTAQGGSGGWIRHRALGTALQQPVPRNTSEDEDGDGGGDGGLPSREVAGWPFGTAAAIGFGLPERDHDRRLDGRCGKVRWFGR